MLPVDSGKIRSGKMSRQNSSDGNALMAGKLVPPGDEIKTRERQGIPTTNGRFSLTNVFFHCHY